jgi:hypothetical protein
VRLAKQVANLPSLPVNGSRSLFSTPLSSSSVQEGEEDSLGNTLDVRDATEALDKLGLRSEGVPLTEEPEELDSSSDSKYSSSKTPSTYDTIPSSSSSSSPSSSRRASTDLSPADLVRLHGNFDQRLLSFFGIKLASARLRVRVYDGDEALTGGTVVTSMGGDFCQRFHFPWGDTTTPVPSTLNVVTELLADEEDVVSIASDRGDRPRAFSSIDVSRHGLVRVVSDIDDTVKTTDVLEGVRAVLHNVFAKDYGDIQVCLPTPPFILSELCARGN